MQNRDYTVEGSLGFILNFYKLLITKQQYRKKVIQGYSQGHKVGQKHYLQIMPRLLVFITRSDAYEIADCLEEIGRRNNLKDEEIRQVLIGVIEQYLISCMQR